jgi:aspartyl/asparaginyl beta-hydroxylase (cupin superfamily)
MSEAEARAAEVGAGVQAALARGDAKGALALVRAAEAKAPGDLQLKLQRALVCRAANDLPGAAEALDEALAIDPYDYVALLSKGAVTERWLGEREAAKAYRNALKVGPPEDRLPPQLKAPTERARAVVARVDQALEEHLRAAAAAVASDCSDAARRRFDESVAILAGTKRVYTQEPLLLHYPRLPAIPFYEREAFPWLPKLEAATQTIQGELQGALEAARDDFAPYIQFPKDAPVNQWGELNHSRLWSSFFLWKDGARQDGARQLCPKTAALLDDLPLADQPGYAPTAMFSALEARTRIPPHTGSTNVRLLCHLPLILPGPAFFRVGAETRAWEMGKAWVFDDTIEHEAWNDADELRVILIFDLWNPFIEEGEKPLINALLAARQGFYAG